MKLCSMYRLIITGGMCVPIKEQSKWRIVEVKNLRTLTYADIVIWERNAKIWIKDCPYRVKHLRGGGNWWNF